MAKSAILLSDHFEQIGEVKLDERRRVSLAKVLDRLKGGPLGEAVDFSISVNEMGQVLLSPEVKVPAHQLWLYKNPEAFALVLKGLAQVGNREKLQDMGSFEKYADDEID
ncbi:MAG TPA: hypothetical protein VMT64_00735 [Candidatus Binataceae bacterium]|nr:hypothetical protein [Candidatus Binataceae bacterium]